MNNIYLTGMMGCGKTTVGKTLAKLLRRQYVDLDDRIEQREGCSINEIFGRLGEDGFRDIETNLLQCVSREEGVVVSCGGGIVLRDENVSAMKATGQIVYIERDADDILACIEMEKRPLLKEGPQKFLELFDARKGRYEATCDFTVKNGKSVEDTAKAVIKLLQVEQ